VGRRVGEIKLPKGVTLAALVRTETQPEAAASGALGWVPGHRVIITHHETLVAPDDHVIVFAVSKRLVPKVEKLFQVGFGFF